ncbi:MAG: HNH endonuclease signature motif containing protein [Pirellula sp.]
MFPATRAQIRERAEFRCEYCQMPEAATPFISFHIEHIVALQHLIDDSLENLALACDRCNAYKGPNLSSIDPETKSIIVLFNPRRDESEHFDLKVGLIVGKTAMGRTTVRLLNMNAPRRVELRLEYLDLGQ